MSEQENAVHPSRLDAKQIEELATLEKAATPGPWEGDRYDGSLAPPKCGVPDDPRCEHCNGSPAVGTKDECQWCGGTGLRAAQHPVECAARKALERLLEFCANLIRMGAVETPTALRNVMQEESKALSQPCTSAPCPTCAASKYPSRQHSDEAWRKRCDSLRSELAAERAKSERLEREKSELLEGLAGAQDAIAQHAAWSGSEHTPLSIQKRLNAVYCRAADLRAKYSQETTQSGESSDKEAV